MNLPRRFNLEINERIVKQWAEICALDQQYCSNCKEENDTKQLLRCTAWILLDDPKRWLSESIQKELLQAFTGYYDAILRTNFIPQIKAVRLLMDLLKNPWPEIVKIALNQPNIPVAVDNLWEKEGLFLLELRLLKLVTLKSAESFQFVANTIHICAVKGLHVLSNSNLVFGNSDLFCFASKEDYYDIIVAYIFLWKKNLLDFTFLRDLPLVELTKIIERAHSFTYDDNCKYFRVIKRCLKGVNRFEACSDVIHEVLIVHLCNVLEDDAVVNAVLIWWKTNAGKICSQGGDTPIKTLLLKLIKMENFFPLERWGVVLNFAKAFVTVQQKPPSFLIEAFVSVAVFLVNRLEVLRLSQPNSAIFKHQQQFLSNHYKIFSELVCEFPQINFQLLLTAFSINPTKENFNSLFYEGSRCQLEVTSTDEEIANLGLSYEVSVDFNNLIHQPRWSSLNIRKLSKLELLKFCELQLTTQYSWIPTGKQLSDLKFVNVDFKLYEKMPSKYDPNDTGIEAGFNEKGKRIKKQNASARSESISSGSKKVGRPNRAAKLALPKPHLSNRSEVGPFKIKHPMLFSDVGKATAIHAKLHAYGADVSEQVGHRVNDSENLCKKRGRGRPRGSKNKVREINKLFLTRSTNAKRIKLETHCEENSGHRQLLKPNSSQAVGKHLLTMETNPRYEKITKNSDHDTTLNKRKRGRPCKAKNSAEVQIYTKAASSAKSSKVCQESSADSGSLCSKRGRGRPRKSNNASALILQQRLLDDSKDNGFALDFSARVKLTEYHMEPNAVEIQAAENKNPVKIQTKSNSSTPLSSSQCEKIPISCANEARIHANAQTYQQHIELKCMEQDITVRSGKTRSKPENAQRLNEYGTDPIGLCSIQNTDFLNGAEISFQLSMQNTSEQYIDMSHPMLQPDERFNPIQAIDICIQKMQDIFSFMF